MPTFSTTILSLQLSNSDTANAIETFTPNCAPLPSPDSPSAVTLNGWQDNKIQGTH